MSAKNGNEVKVERTLAQPTQAVFRALSEGRLFNNCGGELGRMELDFRSGGKYAVMFSNGEMTIRGRFLEIVPDKKIVFTWGDEGSSEGFPKDTRVSIELFAEGQKTRIVILHTGFADQEEADSHSYGWTSGLNDLSGELERGCIRIVRTYPVSRDALYRVCSDPRKFFGCVSDTARGEVDFHVGGQYRFPTEKGEVLGKYEEIVPGKKIVFSWESGCGAKFERPTRVTLLFDDEDEGGSSLELLHELLPQDAVKRHREGWEFVTRELRELVK
jgi:uncharacterized protein YndB with AHSA1/START domain